jgi:carbonic anhydrase
MCHVGDEDIDMENGQGAGEGHTFNPLEVPLQRNREWAREKLSLDRDYFRKLAGTHQTPDYLWIGCSDSRVPANQLMGLEPGQVFVQRNVGNLATHKDMNCMSCLEYGVTALKVKHIIVCGHYNCGAVRAALELPCRTAGLVNLWIQDIREVRDKNAEELIGIESGEERWKKLVELNIVQQVFNVCTSPVVQQAWDFGQPLSIHGLVYSLKDGLLKQLTMPITSMKDFEDMTAGDQDRTLSKSMLTHMSFERKAGK